MIPKAVLNVLTSSLLRVAKGFHPVLGLLTCASLVARAQDWEYLGLGFPETIISAIAVRSSDTIYAGTWLTPPSVGGVYRTTNAGVTWERVLVANVYELQMHPSDPNILYAGFGTAVTPYGIKKTIDGGVSWFDADSGVYVNWETGVRKIEIDPLHPDTLYAGTGGFHGGNIYKSTDGGTSWMAVGTGNLLAGAISIAIHPETTATLYAGTPWTGDLHKSIDGGRSWELTGLQQQGAVPDVVVDPVDPRMIFAAAKPPKKSTNGGLTWTNIGNGLPPLGNPQFLEMSRVDRSLYGGITNALDSSGIFVTTNLGESWNRFPTPFDGGPYFTINLSRDNRQLYAGVYTLGVYRSSVVTDITEEMLVFPRELTLHQNYPNPFNPATSIEYEISHSAHVRLSVVDLLGKEVALLVDELKDRGRYSLTFDASRLASSVYFYKLEIPDGRTIVKRMILLR